MKKTIVTIAAAMAIVSCMPVGAQNLKLKGIGHNNRYDDGEQMRSTYVAWNSEQGKAVFIVDNGIYAMTYDAQGLSMPTKEPAVDIAEVRADAEKQTLGAQPVKRLLHLRGEILRPHLL